MEASAAAAAGGPREAAGACAAPALEPLLAVGVVDGPLLGVAEDVVRLGDLLELLLRQLLLVGVLVCGAGGAERWGGDGAGRVALGGWVAGLWGVLQPG